MDNPKLTWKDSEGHTWSTRLDIPGSIRLRDAGYDLKDHEAFAKVLEDPWSVLEFVVEFHRPQWEEKGLGEIDFTERLTGTDTQLEEVVGCTVEGIVDFFLKFRDDLRAGVYAKALEAAGLGRKKIQEKFASPKLDEALNAVINKAGDAFDAELDRLVSGKASSD